MSEILIFRFYIFLLLIVSFSPLSQGSSCVTKTVSQMTGSVCKFGNDWNSVFNGAKSSMMSVANSESAKRQISSTRICLTSRQSCPEANSGTTAIRRSKNTITIREQRFRGAAQPGSYSVTMMHEICHNLQDAETKSGKTALREFRSRFKGQCLGVSPYASGPCDTYEEFAEVCTAFLVAPSLIQKGCGGAASSVMQFFKENFFKGPITSCVSDPNSTTDSDPSKSALGGIEGGELLNTLGQLAPLALLALQKEEEPPQQEDALAKFCAENPSSQACSDGTPDCSNPEVAKTNTQCLCDVGINPEARALPICNQKGKVVGGTGGFSNIAGLDGRGANLLNDGSLTDILGNPIFDGAAVQGEAPTVNANQKGRGGGGPNATGGGFAGGAGRRGGGGYGPGPYDTNILKGVGKAGGGAGYSGGGGGYGSSSDGYGEAEETLDLKKFLPNNKPNRAVAGMTLKASDGLTGPFGPSIWSKISNRYRKVTPTMKP